jgi:two-component system NarL family response regulator
MKPTTMLKDAVLGPMKAALQYQVSARDGNMPINRILLVDDNRDFLQVSYEFLDAMQDFVVVGTAASATEALDQLEKLTPSIVITDLVMPGMNGLELTALIKQRLPHIRVIVMTMHDTPHHRQAALAAGADAFITKANMDSELEPTIRDTLL